MRGLRDLMAEFHYAGYKVASKRRRGQMGYASESRHANQVEKGAILRTNVSIPYLTT